MYLQWECSCFTAVDQLFLLTSVHVEWWRALAASVVDHRLEYRLRQDDDHLAYFWYFWQRFLSVRLSLFSAVAIYFAGISLSYLARPGRLKLGRG